MGSESQGFYRLHPSVQRWIYDQGWTELRDAQEKAIIPILAGSRDMIIAAATATGKTEAAFLPICSRLRSGEDAGATVLYVSPLKALINDQNDRMGRLCETLGIEVHPWHGDIGRSRKREFLKQPGGILLITPESLESIFVNRGSSIATLFSGLLYVVVDELHSFIGAERGRQLQSLLARVEHSIKRRVPRIALSATLGDMGIAADFLRPKDGSQVELVVSGASGQELRLLVRGYRMNGGIGPPEPGEDAEQEEESDGSVRAVAEDLFRVLRGSTNLAFANSRRDVETYTDLLTRMSEREHFPNEFWAHHGNLSKELREEVEAALKDKSRPCTAVCTSTLELGIDIGSVKSIVQLGTPNSVASLRQRLGRSGRRGDAAILLVSIREPEISGESPIEDCLHFELVQTIAMVNLLLARWCEPPETGRLHLSTLVQQILSVIAQYGGTTAKSAWRILSGSFAIDQEMFIAVLRSLRDKGIIRQDPDGTLLLDEGGERIVNHYSFYAAFATNEEYRIVCGSKTLGTLPIDRPLEANGAIIFAGRRWRIVGVDEQRKIIEVRPASGGRVPAFTGERGDVHDRVRQEMREVYVASAVPVYLDAIARGLLEEGRHHFSAHGLSSRNVVAAGTETVIFTWSGDRVNDTIRLLLARAGHIAQTVGPCIRVSASVQDAVAALEQIGFEPPPDHLLLASQVKNKLSEKYDYLLDDGLLNAEFASRKLNIPAAHAVIRRLIDAGGHRPEGRPHL
jgi:ATP-dependent Lhr-like helicase